jgi:hypothetical protein
MTRTRECEEAVEKAVALGCLTDNSSRKVKRARGIRAKLGLPDEISSVATDAVIELGKEKYKGKLDAALPVIKERASKGKVTKKDVEEILTSSGPKAPFSQKGPVKAVSPTPAAFNFRKRFPLPGTREEILLRQQLNDIGRQVKSWMANPDLAPLHPFLLTVQSKKDEIFGDLGN